MAGDWLKVEVNTPDKQEIDVMAAELGLDPDEVFGKLFRVWRWFDQHTKDGNAPGVTLALLDKRAGVTGFGRAMQSVGWLDVTAAGLSLPNFERHNGETAKSRALTAKRVAKRRNKSNDASVTSDVTSALPREEKRREDSNTPIVPQKGFDAWWAAYPPGNRKSEKGKCAGKWKSLKLEPISAQVMEALEVSKKSRDWKKNNGEFISAPLVWLNKAPWENIGDLTEPDPEDAFKVGPDDPILDELDKAFRQKEQAKYDPNGN